MSDEEKKADEEVKEVVAPKPEAAVEEKAAEKAPEAPAEAKADEATAEVSQEEITGRAESTEVEEEVTPDQVEELPYTDIRPGMEVRVHERILDVSPKGEKRERVQIFQGMVIGMKSGGVSRTMTVRKDSKGWMVEKIFPLSSPNVTKVEVVKKFRVRRAKLNFLRKSTRRKGGKKRFKRKMHEIKESK
ncbi:50S ribosomal protein L19 [Candidatus Uhrbacteria bacterium]|jgi:large subunit ribosomal protein L19|nr:50S ribosomal protein L19 [Candidatus Uhrbacteria bacterium]